MRIALTFLTCDRVPYSFQTLNTLLEHNPSIADNFILLHGDDASKDDAGGELARMYGFKTVVQNTKTRRGVARMTADLFQAAAEAGADTILNLQNDWECKRPLALADFSRILDDERVYCIRMYGVFKSAHGRCGIHHGGREPRRVVEWQPYAPGYEAAEIHWGHPPAITRIEEALFLTKGAAVESQSCRRSGTLTKLTVRPTGPNFFSHIGRERTPEFKG